MGFYFEKPLANSPRELESNIHQFDDYLQIAFLILVVYVSLMICFLGYPETLLGEKQPKILFKINPKSRKTFKLIDGNNLFLIDRISANFW